MQGMTYEQGLPKHRKGKFRFGRALIYAGVGLYCLSSVLAFSWVFMISLKTTTEFLTTSPWALPAVPQFENYLTAWNKAKIGVYFGNSILTSVAGATISVFISSLAAYVIARVPFKFNGLFGNYFLIGYMVPAMLTIIPLFFMMVNLGLNKGLFPLILIYIAAGFPFNTFVLRGFFESLPSELEEAATVDGASPFRVFWQIMLPLAWPGLVSTFLINFLSLWNEFFLALIFLRAEDATLPLGLFYMAQKALYSAQWTDLFAGILIVSVPVLIVFALLQDQITRGMTSGALKG
jgi:raffinose/stachyose/melibiose transport system permease protein/N-acetylglucosamine transport system permease protein